MKYLLPLLFLVFVAHLHADEQVISKTDGADAKVIGIVDKVNYVNSIKFIANKKVVWNYTLGWGYPSSVIVSWSPASTKVAICVRTTKRSSEVHVFDMEKELPVPDLSAVTLALNSQVGGRVLLVSPIGWADEDTLLLRSEGNLVDCGSDGVDGVNFKYLLSLDIPTRRILSVTCLSKQNLNDPSIKQPVSVNTH